MLCLTRVCALFYSLVPCLAFDCQPLIALCFPGLVCFTCFVAMQSSTAAPLARRRIMSGSRTCLYMNTALIACLSVVEIAPLHSQNFRSSTIAASFFLFCSCKSRIVSLFWSISCCNFTAIPFLLSKFQASCLSLPDAATCRRCIRLHSLFCSRSHKG